MKAKKRNGEDYRPDNDSVNEYFYTDEQIAAMEEMRRISNALCSVMGDFGVSAQEAINAFMAMFEPVIELLKTIPDEQQLARNRSKRDVQNKRKQSRGKNRHILPH
jgi:hypothetical protein